MSSRFQSPVISFGIGFLLPVVFTGSLVTPAVIVTIAAMMLWILKVSERKEADLLLPVVGLAVGIIMAVLTAPLLAMPEIAAVVILLFAVLM